ncbi:hypothetical protein VaNZ11_002611 [Volvox africanus]|uniref:Arp2/3 complex 41 kDa subunit n=1 Tax=Volvox africanus TaxID=51714 RepID=A0ABQ5RTA5_9CHLO|nr:hypothetical protein VaNZ11_002611 [Volvox africanus]
MMASLLHQTRLPGPVQAIAWNGDCSSIAVSHCGNDVVLYEPTTTSLGTLSWSKVAVLEGHHQMVSDLDWAPRADQLLSCSYDRNAFVWTRSKTITTTKTAASTTASVPELQSSQACSNCRPHTASPSSSRNGTRMARAASASAPNPASISCTKSLSSGWEKQMVITRLTKGALCVRWSPSEAKFAIGSAARVVSVGYYDPESKWWACKMIRKAHESSVVSVAWHPNSLLLATGSTDRRVRLFNAYVSGYEPEASAGALPPNSSFGDCLVEVSHEGCGWVHSVTWSQGDEALLYAAHDAVVGYVRGPQAQVAVKLSGAAQLPLKCLEVVSERVAVGAGWEGHLVVLTRPSLQDPWSQAGVLGEHPSGGSTGEECCTASTGSLVRQLAQMHIAGGGSGAHGPKAQSGGSAQITRHTACVTGLHARPFSVAGCARQAAWHVASAGLDGQVILWDLSSYL